MLRDFAAPHETQGTGLCKSESISILQVARVLVLPTQNWWLWYESTSNYPAKLPAQGGHYCQEAWLPASGFVSAELSQSLQKNPNQADLHLNLQTCQGTSHTTSAVFDIPRIDLGIGWKLIGQCCCCCVERRIAIVLKWSILLCITERPANPLSRDKDMHQSFCLTPNLGSKCVQIQSLRT